MKISTKYIIKKFSGISSHQEKIIYNIVFNSEFNNISLIRRLILKSIGIENINNDHFQLMTFLIGYRIATEESAINIQNSLKLCQRLN